jgi:UDP:flavonoid glycosyltransferase YjiC (YdhE family)
MMAASIDEMQFSPSTIRSRAKFHESPRVGGHASATSAAMPSRGRRTGGAPPRLGIGAASSALPDALPASIDPSPFADTVRFHEPPEPSVSPPDWWRCSDAPLIYMTFGTALSYMSIAADTYRMALDAVSE